MNDDYDSPWKDVLDQYFEDFLAFFLPDAHAEVDWSRPWESLEKELTQVVRDADTGKRFADKLIKVWLRDGTEQVVLVHVEVQGERDSELPKRMFVYHYRLCDRHDEDIVSIAVLGDDQPNWRPDRYYRTVWGCEKLLRYPVVKLLDYRDRWAELEASTNPFAVMVMAHLATKATRHDPQTRFGHKWTLTTGLHERGYTEQNVGRLFRFIDWLLRLPEDLDLTFREKLKQYEDAMGKPYITSVERAGFQQGFQQARQELNTMLRRQLQQRFGPLPDWAENHLQTASSEEIQRWGLRLLDAPTLEAVFENA